MNKFILMAGAIILSIALDSESKLAECYASEGGSGDSSAPTNSYTYDDEGRIKEITYAYGDGSFITTINYNQDGSITGTQRYTGGGYGDAYHGATYTVDAIRTGGTDDNPLYTIKDANYGNSIEQNDNVPDGSTYALIIDKNGQIVQEGTLYSNGYSAAGWRALIYTARMILEIRQGQYTAAATLINSTAIVPHKSQRKLTLKLLMILAMLWRK